MTNEFKEIVKKVRLTLETEESEYHSQHSMKVEWVTGGSCGGGDDNGTASPVSPEAPKELTMLDLILEITSPHITLLKYKKLYRDVVSKKTRTDSRYAEWTEYMALEVKFDDLENYLIQTKLWTTKMGYQDIQD